MRQRFTVIEGGAGAALPDAAMEAAHDAGPAIWRIDLLRPNAMPEQRIADWRALLTRLRVPDPIFADPDYLLPAAQHQARGAEPVFAFALAATDGRERLEGVVPLTMPHHLWGRSRARLWQPAGLDVAATVNPDHRDAIRDAVTDCLRASGIRCDLDAEAVAPGISLLDRTLAPVRSARTGFSIHRDIPVKNLLGIRPASAPALPTTERIVEPGRIRDAVEEYLTLDAKVSPRPILDDPSESAMIRVVMRLFAQRRQATAEVVRRGDAVVVVRLRLGHGPHGTVWKQVQDRQVGERIAPVDGRITG